MCVDRVENDLVDTEQRASDLLGEHDETLTNFGGGELQRDDSIVDATAGRRVVVEALAVHEVLDADTPAHSAADVMTVGGASAAAGQVEDIGIVPEIIRQWNCRGLPDALGHWRNTVDDLTGDEPIPGLHGVEQSDLHRIDSTSPSQFVHLALVGEAGLHHAETTHCSTRRVVGAQRPTVDDGVVALVGPLGVRDRIDQDRW